MPVVTKSSEKQIDVQIRVVQLRISILDRNSDSMQKPWTSKAKLEWHQFQWRKTNFGKQYAPFVLQVKIHRASRWIRVKMLEIVERCDLLTRWPNEIPQCCILHEARARHRQPMENVGRGNRITKIKTFKLGKIDATSVISIAPLQWGVNEFHW